MGISGITSNLSSYASLLNLNSSSEAIEENSDTANLLDSLFEKEDTSPDILDLSGESNWLASTAASNSPINSLAAQFLCTSISSVSGEITSLQQTTQSSVVERLQSLFKENGIDTSEKVQLEVASDGKVTVANDHPQKEQIEERINSDESLRNDFVKMTALNSLVGAAKEASAFESAYAEDPSSAVAQYSYLFSATSQTKTYLTIEGDECQAVYSRPGYASIALDSDE